MRSLLLLILIFLFSTGEPALSAVEMPGESYLQGLEWLGHSAFRLSKGGKVIYFDPWRLSKEPHDADLILISHSHFDHLDPNDVARAAHDKTIILGPADAVKQLEASGVPGELRSIAPGQTQAIQGIVVEAVPAYNLDKPFHPKENNWVGFVVTLEGVRFYHAGDTDQIPEMENLEVDVALLPVSGTYVMTAQEAAQAAKVINPKVTIPMHYGSIIGSVADARQLQEDSSELIVEILEKQS